jgi:hypothetical protein
MATGAMDYLADTWDSYLVTPLDTLGLADKPTLRAFVLGGLAASAIYYYQPEAQFYKGMARPWSVLEPRNDLATPFPWWFMGGSVGVLAYFIL